MIRTVSRVAVFMGIVGAAVPAQAQTDYYNTDAGRPVTVEDAYATERHAFELGLASLRVERASAGVYSWAVEPEIAYGVLPRTHVEVGLPLVALDAAGGADDRGVGGLELSVLHNLNAETEGLPALGVRADVVLPVGGLAPEEAHASLTALVTRTARFARFHVNGSYTFGDSSGGSAEVHRWLAGLAIDRAFPLDAFLITGEVYARKPLGDDEVEWNAGAGIRYQVGVRTALDFGLGRRLSGNPAWYFTLGSAYAFGLRGLIGS